MKPKIKCASIAMSALLAAQSLPLALYSINAADSDYVVTENILSGAEYTFINKLSGKLITADTDGNVLQRSADDNQHQKWQIIKVDEKYCRFVCANDRNLALTVDDAATPNGSNISVAKYIGADTQLFQIKHDDSAYYITTKCSNDASAIDVKGKSSAEDANIHQYKYQGNDNQLFDIVPVDNEYSWIRGDLDLDGKIDAFDMILMRKGLINGFDEISSGIADMNGNGKTEISDGVLMKSYILGKKTEIDPYFKKSVTSDKPVIPEIPSVPSDGIRKMEYLNRGVNAVSTGKNVFVSWRSLADDAPDTAFNVYRVTDGKTVKLNESPLTKGTNYTDTTADLKKKNTYFVKSIINGKEIDTDGEFTLDANSTAQAQIINIKKGGEIHFVWVGDFNGDGAYDYLVDRCVDEHQKLEAYLNDGTYLWTVDLGYNSENKNNITPGASTIDVGMWDGATVYDIDCDGYAEVLVRIADGVTFGDGKKYSNTKHKNAQAIAVIDGKTGALEAESPVPDDYINIGPMACMMEIGYLDGENPSIICWTKNRNKDKSFNSLTLAYGYDKNGKFGLQWKYDNKKSYAEAHQIRVADVNYDGKDEVLHMGYALNGDGSLRYTVDKVVHGDRWYVGSFCNDNNGKEMMGYGIQQNNQSGLLEYFYNASTGEIIWDNFAEEGTADVARGNVGDIDPNHDGFECWSFQGLYSMNGKKISNESLYPVIKLWWDGDILSESYNDGKIEKWDYKNNSTQRIASTWKMTDCQGSERGAPMFFGDILGDWREEVVMTSANYSKLVILSTANSTDTRLTCLAQDPCYRNCMTAKGYYQSHMTSYFIGSEMKNPEVPDISIIKK